jgi:hypothetical protein
MGLSNRGKQPLISVFRFDDGFIGLRNVFLEGNRVPQLTLSARVGVSEGAKDWFAL